MARTTSTTDAQKSDHDLLVELATRQELNHAALLEKIGSVQSDLTEVKTGITSQLAEHNARIMILETFRQTKAADEKIAFWNYEAEWVKSFRGRWKWIAGLIGIGAGIVGFIASTLIPLIDWR